MFSIAFETNGIYLQKRKITLVILNRKLSFFKNYIFYIKKKKKNEWFLPTYIIQFDHRAMCLWIIYAVYHFVSRYKKKNRIYIFNFVYSRKRILYVALYIYI